VEWQTIDVKGLLTEFGNNHFQMPFLEAVN
jgi:hypothetical protein